MFVIFLVMANQRKQISFKDYISKILTELSVKVDDIFPDITKLPAEAKVLYKSDSYEAPQCSGYQIQTQIKDPKGRYWEINSVLLKFGESRFDGTVVFQTDSKRMKIESTRFSPFEFSGAHKHIEIVDKMSSYVGSANKWSE